MDDKLQYLLDIHEIRQVSVRYNRYADASDGEHFAALFTEDGEFDIVGNQTYHGRKEIASVCNGSIGIVHLAVDSIVEVDGDHATQTSKLIIGKIADDKSSMDLIGTTTMRDQFVRQGGQWLIKRRQSHIDTDPQAALARLAVKAG
jgi:uncharacterized protein (TIGR02246 family)